MVGYKINQIWYNFKSLYYFPPTQQFLQYFLTHKIYIYFSEEEKENKAETNDANAENISHNNKSCDKLHNLGLNHNKDCGSLNNYIQETVELCKEEIFVSKLRKCFNNSLVSEKYMYFF